MSGAGTLDVVVTGAGGNLGSVLMPLALNRGLRALGTVSPSGLAPAMGEVLALDLREPAALVERLLANPPRVIVHLAAVSRVADAARDPIRAHEINVEVTGELSTLAKRVGARFVYASTEMVFDGLDAPYDERATPQPVSHYGRTKLAGEAYALTYEQGVVARLPLLFGIPPLTPDACHLADLCRSLSGDAPPARLFVDEFRTPLSLSDAAGALLDLAGAPALTGVVHLGGAERVSRLEFGRRFSRALGTPDNFEAVRSRDLDLSEPRPPDLSLVGDRFRDHFGRDPGGDLDHALQAVVTTLRGKWGAPRS